MLLIYLKGLLSHQNLDFHQKKFEFYELLIGQYMNLLEEKQIGKVWKVYYFENSWKGNYTYISGNLPFLRECSKMIFNGKISDWLQIFIILIDILSQPWALLGSNVFIIANISFSVTWKDLILLPVLYEKDGKQLVLSIGVYIEAKKLLKMFAFLQKSEINLLSTRRGGIVGSFLL